jgi:23S rRNA (pseudouridine1915-N3)-methyltransferase
MRVTVGAIGRLKAGPDRELFDRYWDRLEGSGRQVGITSVKLVELADSRAAGVAERKADEAARLLKSLRDGTSVIALDETGRSLTSAKFAQHIARLRDDGQSDVAFLIGGPDGHDPSVLKRATLVLNLGTLTLPHGLARIVLAEQLYRATTILSGHPYHRV